MEERILQRVANALTDPDSQIRLDALQSLVQMHEIDERLAPTLTALLVDDHAGVRNLAERILPRVQASHHLEVGGADKKFRPVLGASVRPQREEDALFWELGNADQAVREQTADTLRSMGQGEIGHLLSKALDGDRHAADQIIHLKDDRVIPPLLRAHVQHALVTAADCLVGLGDMVVQPLVDLLRHPQTVTRAGIPMLLAKVGAESAIDPLIERLHEEPEEVVRCALIDALGYFPASDVLEVLHRFLTDEHPDLQARAAMSLGRLRETSSLEAIIGLLTSHEETVREAAASALGLMGSDRAIEPLIVVMHNEAETVREAACESLQQLTGDFLGPLLVDLFRGKHDAPRRLAELRSPFALDPLHWALLEGDPMLREECARALALFDPDRVLQMLSDALSDEEPRVGEAARDSLVGLGTMAVVSLAEVIHHPEPRVRVLVLEAVGRIADAGGMEAAIDSLADHNPRVRSAAVNALGQIGDPAAVGPLLEHLQDPNHQLVADILQNLGRLRSPESLNPLINSLRSSEASIRLAAIDGLTALGDPRAVPPLQAVASFLNRRESPVIKDAAKEAIERLEAVGYERQP